MSISAFSGKDSVVDMVRECARARPFTANLIGYVLKPLPFCKNVAVPKFPRSFMGVVYSNHIVSNSLCTYMYILNCVTILDRHCTVAL